MAKDVKQKTAVFCGLLLLPQLLVYMSFKNAYSYGNKPFIDVYSTSVGDGIYFFINGMSVGEFGGERRTNFSLVDLPFRFNVSNNNSTESKKLHHILIYTKKRLVPFDRLNRYLPMCEYNNCRVTDDRAIRHTASAIVFNIAHAGVDFVTSPPVSEKERNPSQPWIFLARETQLLSDIQPWMSREWSGVFNWSMTYRLDSNILSPYGYFKTREKPVSKNYSEIFKNKTKMAIWLVSNCDSSSKRNDFVRTLRKHGVNVDVFGKCGSKRLSRDIDDILSRYKFHLSLENAYCEDYVTEKVFDRYNSDLLLVVRGGADYHTLLPTNTFINTQDFNTTAELAKYMLSLAEDKDAYVEFLQRKDQFESFGPWPFGWMYGFCELCKRVNNVEKYKYVHKHPSNFLYSPQCRQASDVQ